MQHTPTLTLLIRNLMSGVGDCGGRIGQSVPWQARANVRATLRPLSNHKIPLGVMDTASCLTRDIYRHDSPRHGSPGTVRLARFAWHGSPRHGSPGHWDTVRLGQVSPGRTKSWAKAET